VALGTFFSYSHVDTDFTIRLTGDLKAAGAMIWLDKDIAPGDRWDMTVQDALKNCQHLLVILSPDSVNSPNVLDEVAFGLDTKKTVIPILYRECEIPFRLGRVQWIDFRTDYAHGLERLVERLGLEAKERARQEAPPPTPAYVPPAPVARPVVASEHTNRSVFRSAILPVGGVVIAGALLAFFVIPRFNHKTAEVGAQTSTPSVTQPAPVPVTQPTASARTLPRLTYGIWTLHNAIDDSKNDWSNSVLQFTSQEPTPDGLLLKGTFSWRLSGELAGTEEVTGHYVEATRQVILEGTSIKSVHPRQLRLAMGSYSATLGPEGRRLLDGRWGSTATEAGVPGQWEASR
jgi:TIR domain